jgi:predicted transcriptional regulator
MSRTAVVLDDEQWARVLDVLDGDDEAVQTCRDAVAEQVRDEQAERDVDEQTDTLDADTAFELLSDPVRRELLWTCRERGEVSIEDLVDSVAGEVGSDPQQLGVSLHHTHIPKLANAGVVTRNSDTIQYAGDDLLDYLVAVDRK